MAGNNTGYPAYNPAMSYDSSSGFAAEAPPVPASVSQPNPSAAGYLPASQQATAAYWTPHQVSAAGHPHPQQSPAVYQMPAQQTATAPTGVAYAAPQGSYPYGGYPPPQPARYGYAPYPAAGYTQPQQQQKPFLKSFLQGLIWWSD